MPNPRTSFTLSSMTAFTGILCVALLTTLTAPYLPSTSVVVVGIGCVTLILTSLLYDISMSYATVNGQILGAFMPTRANTVRNNGLIVGGVITTVCILMGALAIDWRPATAIWLLATGYVLWHVRQELAHLKIIVERLRAEAQARPVTREGTVYVTEATSYWTPISPYTSMGELAGPETTVLLHGAAAIIGINMTTDHLDILVDAAYIDPVTPSELQARYSVVDRRPEYASGDKILVVYGDVKAWKEFDWSNMLERPDTEVPELWFDCITVQ